MEDNEVFLRIIKDGGGHVYRLYASFNPDLPFVYYIVNEKQLYLTVNDKGKYFINYPTEPNRYNYRIPTTCNVIEGKYKLEIIGNVWYLDYVSK